MLLAISDEGEIAQARPKMKGSCPCCGFSVTPKCGKINIWHWAHKNYSQCDLFYEPETDWHRKWKYQFDKSQIEVVIERGNQKHRADIYSNGIAIEFQYSTISVEDIHDRENFYINMIWVFNAEKAYNNERLILDFYNHTKGKFCNFIWLRPKKSIWHTECPVFLDFGTDELIHAKRLTPGKRGEEAVFDDIRGWYSPGSKPYTGWGPVISKESFIEKYRTK